MTDSFIVYGANLEYTKKRFEISWWMMLFWSIYILKPEIEVKIVINHDPESVS